MTKQTKHIRRSAKGKRFIAGSKKKVPNLMLILNSKDKDLANAFVDDRFVKKYDALQVNIEAYNKAITSTLDRKIRKIVNENELKLLKKFGGSYIEINTFGLP